MPYVKDKKPIRIEKTLCCWWNTWLQRAEVPPHAWNHPVIKSLTPNHHLYFCRNRELRVSKTSVTVNYGIRQGRPNIFITCSNSQMYRVSGRYQQMLQFHDCLINSPCIKPVMNLLRTTWSISTDNVPVQLHVLHFDIIQIRYTDRYIAGLWVGLRCIGSVFHISNFA